MHGTRLPPTGASRLTVSTVLPKRPHMCEPLKSAPPTIWGLQETVIAVLRSANEPQGKFKLLQPMAELSQSQVAAAVAEFLQNGSKCPPPPFPQPASSHPPRHIPPPQPPQPGECADPACVFYVSAQHGAARRRGRRGLRG